MSVKPRTLFESGAILVTIGILCVMVSRLITSHGLLLSNGQPMFGDFISFWSAARGALDGHVAQLHDHTFLAKIQQHAIPGMHVMAPWNSPPPFLLLLLPFGLFPYPAAAVMFLIITGSIYLFAASKWLPDSRALLFALTMPAAFYHVGTEQTGLFIAGISGLALYFLDTRPRLAGALVGLLIIKPHLAILWPIYLAVTGRWRAFFAAAISVFVFCAAAGIAFGFDAYPRFIHNLPQAEVLVSGIQVPRQTFGSLFGNLLAFHLPLQVAIAAQAISALCALGVAIWTFRKGDARTQGAAFCATTLLLSPYLFFYDFTLLGVGGAILLPARNRAEIVVIVLAWAAGLSVAFGYYFPFPLCALAAWLVLLTAFARTRSAAPALAPALQT